MYSFDTLLQRRTPKTIKCVKNEIRSWNRDRYPFQEDFIFILHPFRAPGRPSGAQDASKAPQERSQTLLETLFGRLCGSLGTLLGGLGPFWSAQGHHGVLPRLFGSHFRKDFKWISKSIADFERDELIRFNIVRRSNPRVQGSRGPELQGSAASLIRSPRGMHYAGSAGPRRV